MPITERPASSSAAMTYNRCCSWLHRLERLKQAQARDGNSGY